MGGADKKIIRGQCNKTKMGFIVPDEQVFVQWVCPHLEIFGKTCLEEEVPTSARVFSSLKDPECMYTQVCTVSVIEGVVGEIIPKPLYVDPRGGDVILF